VLGVAIEFERIKKKIHKLSKDTYLKEKLGGKQVFITERQTRIIEYIQSIGYLQNKMFGEMSEDVSEDTILRDLTDLIEKGIVKKVGSTKAARYEMV
jgi:predicted HTH transcriptional regulator